MNSLVRDLLTIYYSTPSFFDLFDFHLVQNSKQLNDVLKTESDFIKAGSSSRVVNTHDWNIRKQVDSMGNEHCVAYQRAKSSKNNIFSQRIDVRGFGRISLGKKVELFRARSKLCQLPESVRM